MSLKSLVAAGAVAACALSVGLASPSAAGSGSVVSGAVWKDDNRNQAVDAGEAPVAGLTIYLYDGTGTSYVATAVTDSAGRYSFGGLADGSYQVTVDPAAWGSWQQDWVPTTTPGSLFPRRTLAVQGGATVDFGLRRIVRSSSPVTAVTGPSGLRVESYDDVVAAQELYDDLLRGSLIGEEAPDITVRFDAGSTSSTTTSTTSTSYSAVSYVAYGSWLSNGDGTLFHEYGHAWSLYFASMVQHDTTLSGYLSARGLSGDSRVGSSYEWSPREMIAEDYRQLFGTTTAQAPAQMNTAIPPAGQVPGLADYLRGSFRASTSSTSPSPSPSPSPSASPAPQPALMLSTPTVNPQPVSKSGTVSVTASLPTTMSMQITDGSGQVVRTLLASSARPAGSTSATWDRKSAAGQRVRSGTYVAVVSVTDQYGRSQSTQAPFQVS